MTDREAAAASERPLPPLPTPRLWIIPGAEGNGRESGFEDAMWHESGEFTKPLFTEEQMHAYALADRAASAPQASRPTCPACGTYEVSLERTCHNSTCKEYAHATTIYEGWKEPTKESALAASIAEKERKWLANSALVPQDSTKEGTTP